MSNSVRPHRRHPTRLPCPWDSLGKNTGVGCHFLLQCMKVKSESEVAQKCPTLSDPMDCSLPGSSVHGICQARVLEWVAIAFLHIYTVEYYYVIRNELPSHEKTWRNLKCISLSESRQSTKAACYLIPMMWYSQNGKTMEKIKRSEAARCSRKGWVRVRKRGSLNK